MKKQLNTALMENELKSGSVFFQKPVGPLDRVEEENVSAPLPSPTKTLNSAPQPITPGDQGIEVTQPVDQSIDRSTKQSTQQLIGRVVNRPVAFYIPEIINKKIDEAMQYYQDKRRLKFDRSALVSAILGNPENWTPKALDQLIDKVTEQLTSRLTSRLSD